MDQMIVEFLTLSFGKLELATEKGLDVAVAENALIAIAWPTKPGRLSELG